MRCVASLESLLLRASGEEAGPRCVGCGPVRRVRVPGVVVGEEVVEEVIVTRVVGAEGAAEEDGPVFIHVLMARKGLGKAGRLDAVVVGCVVVYNAGLLGGTLIVRLQSQEQAYQRLDM